MSRKMIFSMLTIGALLAVVLGVSSYSLVKAAAPDRSQAALGGSMRGGPDFDRGGRFDGEELANALGITVDELNSASEIAQKAILAAAVEKGLITQAQADEALTDGRGMPLGGHGGGWLVDNGIDFNTYLAEALGITVEDLDRARAEAEQARIDQAIADGRLTQEQADLMAGQKALFSNDGFKSAMQSAYQAAMKQAVESGVITQAQADAILANASGTGFGGFPGGLPGMGGPNGHPGHGGHGMWEGAPGAQTAPTATP